MSRDVNMTAMAKSALGTWKWPTNMTGLVAKCKFNDRVIANGKCQ